MLVRHFHYLGIGLTGPISAAICAMVFAAYGRTTYSSSSRQQAGKKSCPFPFWFI